MNHESLWWRDGVIYQIYPRSFMDSSGDGIGDLPGIIGKLDYLHQLGVDALWLSPVYPSPDVDFGYDVSDFLNIDPKYGSLQDFDLLVKKAERAGIKIIMDLVLNHTSDQHEWFRQSRQSRTNPFQDFYLWQDADKNGNPPNNWLSVFGSSAWHWDAGRQQFYYHMFCKEQPDLNWRNSQVRQKLMDVFRFWLDRGAKGFRLDVFNVNFKDDRIRNNPYKLSGIRPFDRQHHLYDCDRPEMLDALAEIRSILDKYEDAYLVGETFLSAPEKAAAYCGESLLHQAFNFKFLESGWRAGQFARAVEDWESVLGSNYWPNYVLNNHDVTRSASRYAIGEDDERLKLAAAMLLTLRGTPFIYYGEEIGMRNIRFKRSEILDPVGKHYWPFHKGRDGCRSPMQWDASLNAGFTQSHPWLPVHPDWQQRNIALQMQQPDSLLSCYQQLIALRRQHAVIRRGDLTILKNMPAGIFAYQRQSEGETLLVLLNFMHIPRQVLLTDGSDQQWQPIFSTKRESGPISGNAVQLAADEGLLLLAEKKDR